METEELTGGKRCAQFFANYWRTLVVIITPLCFLPIPILYPDPQFKCLYVVLCIAVLWVTEALPLPITSIIPMAAFPLLNIMNTKDVCLQYLTGTVVMLIVGIILALAIEYSNLHKRIALGTILIVGCSMRKLHIGLCTACTFMSLWIVNTAATAMFLPVIKAILEELEEHNICQLYLDGRKSPTDEEKLQGDDLPTPSKISNCFYISMAFSSSIGGIGTMIGTGTNLVFVGIYEEKFPTQEIDFVKFSSYSFPLSVVMEVLLIVWLQLLYMGLFRPKSEDAKLFNIGKEAEDLALKLVKAKYQELGRMTTHEKTVAIGFTLFVFALIFKSPGFMPGWSIISKKKIAAASCGVVFVVMFFILPVSYECLKFFTKSSDVPRKTTKAVLVWGYINAKMQWGLVLLLGGGFALSEAGNVSGMSAMIGESLSILKPLPHPVILFIILIICEGMTNLSSNVAISNIVLPVLREMSLVIEIHPVYLMLPACLACSMAFLLPVGTPPNALVQGFALIRTKDLAIAGLGATVITIAMLWVWAMSFGLLIFPGSNEFPQFAKDAINATAETKS